MRDMAHVWIGVTVVGLLMAGTSAGTALAQGSDKLKVSAKVGAGVAPRYEGADNYSGVPLWNLKVSNLYHADTFVQLANFKLTSNLLPYDNLRLGPIVEYIPNRGNVGDSVVNRLEHVDSSLLVGGLIGYDFKLPDRQVIGVEFQGRQDVSSSQGYLLTGLARYVAPFGQSWTLVSKLSTTYASSDYMDAYFGVSARNAQRSGLDQFEADSGIKDATLDLRLNYQLSDAWSLGAVGRYSRLFNDAKDSPLVDDRGDENQFFAGLLVGYQF